VLYILGFGYYKEMTYTNLETVWQHSAITSLSFLSKRLLAVGCGNILSIYDLHKKSVLCKYVFKPFVIIHVIETIPDLKHNCYILCVCGNRFINVMRFYLPSSSLLSIFGDYHCDNVIHCTTYPNELSLYVQALFSHGLFKVIKLSRDTNRNNGNIDCISVQLETSVCYAGHIFRYSSSTASLYSSFDKTLVFCGSTFGNICMYTIPNSNLSQSLIVPSLCLCSQKGVIFSIDFCCLASDDSSFTRSFRLASCAEDRSIAIWSTSSKSDRDISDSNHWTLMYNLKAGSFFDGGVIFESRIWCVRVGDWGIIATGEDCRVVYYHWDKIAQPTVMRNIHRGQSVWCCCVWSENTEDCESILLATGGNDGAICVRELKTHHDHCSKLKCVVLPCHALPTNNTAKLKTECSSCQQVSVNFKEKDFARVLFFGSNGRLFYITNLGLIYTYFDTNDPIVRQVCPNVHRLFEDKCTILQSAKSSTKPNIFTTSFLSGYMTCSTNSNRSYVVVGNISGHLLLIKLLKDSPFMEWLDIININDKIMKIIWIHSSYLITGLPNGNSLIISLSKVESTISFGKKFTIIQSSNSSTNMKWLNAASELIPVCDNSTESNDENILLTGTRDGGIYSYVVSFLTNSKQVYTPVWLSKSCHKRGGCTSILVVKSEPNCNILSCGRTYGEVKYWCVQSNGSLSLLGTVLRSDHLTWIERLYRSNDNEIYALGFQSKFFKAISLNHKCIQTANQLDWSFICPIRQDGCFVIDCNGGNHYWDWFLPSTLKTDKLDSSVDYRCGYDFGVNIVDDETVDNKRNFSTPIFASINRGKVVIQSDLHSCLLSCKVKQCNFEPIYLNSFLHGQTINTCLLLNKCDIFSCQDYYKGNSNNQQIELYCLTGGEDTLISSLELSLPLTTSAATVNEPISSFPQHHRGHISSIRCMNLPYIFTDCISSIQETISKRYMLTAGGRGQICLWQLVSSSNNLEVVTGFLGSKKIRHDEYYRVDDTSDDNDNGAVEQSCGDNDIGNTKHSRNVVVSSDIRVMAMTCVQIPRQEDQPNDNILVISGCSDGYVHSMTLFQHFILHDLFGCLSHNLLMLSTINF
ncbi:WD repeat-containing 6-like protein, partial [Schistosoma japonicum]